MTHHWCIREADLALACAILEKERLLMGGSRHDHVMAQDKKIEDALRVASNTRGMVQTDDQLSLGGVA